jgi:hypothetical protein
MDVMTKMGSKKGQKRDDGNVRYARGLVVSNIRAELDASGLLTPAYTKNAGGQERWQKQMEFVLSTAVKLGLLIKDNGYWANTPKFSDYTEDTYVAAILAERRRQSAQARGEVVEETGEVEVEKITLNVGDVVGIKTDDGIKKLLTISSEGCFVVRV